MDILELLHIRRKAQGWQFDPSLVLYLPLYELDGAEITSKDRYGRSCTVTGALWTSQGRDFDGDNDIITLPSAPIASGNYSAFFWCKSDAQDESGNSLMNLSGAGWSFYFGGSELTDHKDRYGVEGSSYWKGNTNIVINTWTFVGYSLTGANYSFVFNGAADGVVAGTADIPGTVIGSRSGSYFFNGKIGEVILKNRATLPSEWRDIYQATKWRYA